MDSEDDDICILPHSDEDIDIDAGFNPIVPFSPFPRPATTVAAPDLDPGCHYALEKAYLTLKQKLSESRAQNQQLARRVQELELSVTLKTQPPPLPELTDSFSVNTCRIADQQPPPRTGDLDSLSLKTRELDSFVNIGESFDMMEDVRYVGESGAEGTRPMTQGELESRLAQYREALSQKNQTVNSLSQQVAQLQEEKRQLQHGLEAERVEKERALFSLQELREKCNSLEQEREKAMKEGAALHASLQKASVEMAALKKQGESSLGGTDPPPELVNELAHMRRVIDKLKAMVLMQKDCLVNQSMTMSRNSLNQSPCDTSIAAAAAAAAAAASVGSMEPPNSSSSPSHHLPTGSGGSGSHSGHSWEMVNGVTAHPSPADLRQQQLQQRSAKMIPVDLNPRRDSPVKSSGTGHPAGNAGKVVTGGNQNGAVLLNIQNGPMTSNNLNSQKVIPRRNSENVIHQSRDVRASENSSPRAHTLPQKTQHGGLAEWMGNHYQQQQQQQQVGLNQLMSEAGSPRYPAEAGQRMASPSRPVQPGVPPYAQTSHPYPESRQRQASPVSQPHSTYDNIVMPSSSSSNPTPGNHGNTGPSMHILNQSSMTGGRVLQNNSGSFGGGGGVIAPNPHVAAVSISRDSGGGMGFRGQPQEHSEVPAGTQNPPRARNPTDLELNTPPPPQPIRFANEPEKSGLDRKCPVCGQDFSHICMDEFQTHVFECFDDDDDINSNPPETLQAPGQMGAGQPGCRGRGATDDRVCPMCAQSFADNVTQQQFESHVQSHFEEVADPFELLDIHRT